jgi:hypothetical protein
MGAETSFFGQLMMTRPTIFAPELSAELEWVCSVIFNDYLGIDYVIETSTVKNFRLCYDHRTIALPNVFFALASDGLLNQSYLPKTPLDIWNSQTYGQNITLVERLIPIIYGTAEKSSVVTDDYIYIPIDILGSVFFMLSRYEEAVNHERDAHDRFPASASLAYCDGFLDRPIVDEYVEILWVAMKRLWSGLERKQRTARTLVSCDLDSPFDPACASLYRLGKRLLGRTWREKSFRSASSTIKNHLAVRHGDYSYDPYRSTIDWIMDVNEKSGNQVAFYFIPEQTDQKIDNDVSLGDPRVRALMRTIHVRGHEIGLHPGYNTYKHPEAFAQSVGTLRRIMEEENIQQRMLGGRQHYLRWETPTTAQLWDANGLTYDTTLCYPDRPGFRCGTCHEYPMFDLANRKPLKLLQRPLVVMESTIIGNGGALSYSDEEALYLMQRYKQICHQFDGDFTLLWHNSYFENIAAKEIYCEVIK